MAGIGAVCGWRSTSDVRVAAAVFSFRASRFALMRWWPLPALVTWGLAWAVFASLREFGATLWSAWLLALLMGAVGSVWGNTTGRRILLVCGFPVSAVLVGIAQMAPRANTHSAHVALSYPAWVWLIPLVILLLLYPARSWRDAPMFPTPFGALRGLACALSLKAQAGHPIRILDAGCGMGDALRELHREYPSAQLSGLEWSWPLRWISARRAPLATVKRADMWAADWSPFDFVYLFQRPESLLRAVVKASAELRPGAWLGSMEFEATAWMPQAVHDCADGRRLWLYQVPFKPRP